MPEAIPVSNVISELDSQWNASNVTKPVLIELNSGTSTAIRIDLNRGDYLIGQAGTPTLDETTIGNWSYVSRTYSVILELQTRVSRQRLYDLMAEVRRICHARRHSMTNFQRVQFEGFYELTQEQANIWAGTVSIQLVNNAVQASTS